MFLDELDEAEAEQLSYDQNEMGHVVPTCLLNDATVQAGLDTEEGEEDDGEEEPLSLASNEDDEDGY